MNDSTPQPFTPRIPPANREELQAMAAGAVPAGGQPPTQQEIDWAIARLASDPNDVY